MHRLVAWSNVFCREFHARGRQRSRYSLEMPHRIIAFLVFVAVLLSCASMLAQEKTPRDRLFAGRAQYYTPTASGLKSFRCEATVDWKAMLTRFGGTEIPENSPILKYLQGVRLSVV